VRLFPFTHSSVIQGSPFVRQMFSLLAGNEAAGGAPVMVQTLLALGGTGFGL
jgi:hypothetical protein